MSDLESTRPGWIGRAIGVSFILLAIGLAVWGLQVPGGIVWLSLITLAAGVANFHLGTIRIRRAREHHELMERHRQLIETHRDLPGGAR
jgi:quinol-cytochrome oxidoreductase complex cytochrome b subunit